MKFRFYYAGVRVRDLKRSVEFYTKAFGMKVVNKGTMPHGGKFVQLRGNGSEQTLELNWYPPGSKFFTEYVTREEMDHLAFVVKDAAKAYKELISKGATSAGLAQGVEGDGGVRERPRRDLDRAPLVRLRPRSSRRPSGAARALWRSSLLRPCA